MIPCQQIEQKYFVAQSPLSSQRKLLSIPSIPLCAISACLPAGTVREPNIIFRAKHAKLAISHLTATTRQERNQVEDPLQHWAFNIQHSIFCACLAFPGDSDFSETAYNRETQMSHAEHAGPAEFDRPSFLVLHFSLRSLRLCVKPFKIPHLY